MSSRALWGGHRGSGSSLLDAILGTLIQLVLALAIGTPIGIMAGTFLAETGKQTRIGTVTRFVNDVLLSAPSILIGLFVYKETHRAAEFGLFRHRRRDRPCHHHHPGRRARHGGHAEPRPDRTSRSRLCPWRQWKVVSLITWRAAKTGITTGILLALARAAGETAPLIFTSFGNSQLSFDLSEPMASLPIAIYQYAGSPAPDWVSLAWVEHC